MLDISILNALGRAINAVRPGARVFYPNEPIDALDASSGVYFEAFVSGRDLIRETETAYESAAVGTIVVTGTQNEGTELLDNIAEDLIWQFSPDNPSDGDDFTEVDATTGRKARVYTTGVKRSEMGIIDNRLKITIFVTFDIYEEKE